MITDPTQIQTITLTPAAVQAVRGLMAERNLDGFALRIFISGAGCSGFQYGMALESNIREQDLTVEFDDVKVVIDEVSINYLRGSTVDYIESEEASGFRIDNPNMLSSCSGCSSSSGSGCSSGCC